MKIILDKEDTQKVFKEFVDKATREYINQSISKLFNERVEEIITTRLEKIDLDQSFTNKINNMVDKHFKPDWCGEVRYINNVIKDKMLEIDFNAIVTEKFKDEIVKHLCEKLVLRI